MSHTRTGPSSERAISEVADLSARRAIEPDRRLELVLKCTGDIAHEFNNILTAIVGFSDMLLADLGPADARCADVAEIRVAAGRATALTRRLLQINPSELLHPQPERPAAQAVVPPRCAEEEPPREASTILLIEDEDLVRVMIRKILERLGYEILEASDGQEGLEVGRAYKGPIHLLLTDLAMPRLNGYQVASELVTERPDMRVLFMSGGTEQRELVARLHHDHMPFVAKPFTPDALARRVHALLRSPAPITSERGGCKEQLSQGGAAGGTSAPVP